LTYNYYFLPFDLVAVFLFGVLRFETLRFFGALAAARFLAAAVLFLLTAVLAAASAFSLAFRLRVLAAFTAAALLWALV
jgi:hypothetical protein